MRTTALIVEFLVTGVAYLAAIAGILFELLPGPTANLVGYLHGSDTWALATLVVLGALAYVFGFIINFVAYQLLRPVERAGFRKHFEDDAAFRRAEARLLMESADEHQQQYVSSELGFLRLSRAATLVAFLFAIAAALQALWLGVILAVFFVLLGVWSTRFRAERYFALVKHASGYLRNE